MEVKVITFCVTYTTRNIFTTPKHIYVCSKVVIIHKMVQYYSIKLSEIYIRKHIKIQQK